MNKILPYYIILFLLLFTNLIRANNPVVQTCYTADPAPMVYKDTVFLYTGHDEDTATYYRMNNWKVYSSTDMVNWTDRGTPLSYKTFSWAKGDAWASQCVYRNNKFYWYICLTHKTLGRPAIGVAVSDNPTGPFKDALGKPLITANWGDIDPSVFIDDDGQAYLYWGNPGLWYVKLKVDMISYSGSVVKVPLTEAGFGKRIGNPDRSTLYEEAPWFYKRNGLYYLLFAAGGIPEHISYSTSTSPTGPWVYRDTIMPSQGGSFTNHPGVIDFKGNSYFFYHSGALPNGGGFRRSVCIEPFSYNADGSFPRFNMTTKGVKTPLHTLNPYKRTEAETISWSVGVRTEPCSNGGLNVSSIHNKDYIKIENVDLGTGASTFDAIVATGGSGGTIKLYLNGLLGTLIGSGTVENTGGWQNWVTKTITLNSSANGIHDLYIRFSGNTTDSLFNFDYWNFNINTSLEKETISNNPIIIKSSSSGCCLSGTQPEDKITIYNALGQILESQTAVSDRVILHLNKGLNIIEVKTTNGRYVTKYMN